MLPGSVDATLTRYLALVEAHASDLLLGVYLVGSVALDDYQEGLSDIDFVAVTRRDIGAAAIGLLRSIHDAMRERAPAFDGIYVDADMLATPPVSPSIVPFSVQGVFEVGPAFETNPAVWLCLAQRGIRIRGPEVSSLTIAQEPRHLENFLVTNLKTYWTGWMAECRATLASRPERRDVSAEAYAWGVLGTARIACSLSTGRIVSKSEAGLWAIETYPREWHKAIHLACTVRRDFESRPSIERFAEALAFMEMLIGGATRRPSPLEGVDQLQAGTTHDMPRALM